MMVKLVLDEEQSQLVESHSGSIEVFDRSGRRLGFLAPSSTEKPLRYTLTVDEAKELARRINSGGPFCTMQEVLERLGDRGIRPVGLKGEEKCE